LANIIFLDDYPEIGICCDIIFKGFDDVRDKAFHDFILYNKRFENLDYIVIALGNNNDNIEVARYIRNRLRERNSANINYIEPIIMVSEKNEKEHGDEIIDDTFTFGCLENIYTHNEIIDEKSDKLANAVHEVYRKLEESDKHWDKLGWSRKELNYTSADFMPAMLFLANKIEPIRFPIDESVQKTTSNTLFNRDNITEKKNRKAICETLIKLNESDNIETLAKTERRRFNATMAVLGYRKLSVDDMIKNERYISHYKKYNYFLASWDNLDGKTCSFKEGANEIVNNIDKRLRKGEFKEKETNDTLIGLKEFWERSDSYNTKELTRNIINNIGNALKCVNCKKQQKCINKKQKVELCIREKKGVFCILRYFNRSGKIKSNNSQIEQLINDIYLHNLLDVNYNKTIEDKKNNWQESDLLEMLESSDFALTKAIITNYVRKIEPIVESNKNEQVDEKTVSALYIALKRLEFLTKPQTQTQDEDGTSGS